MIHAAVGMQVCWGREEPFVGGCYTTAIVAGVDDAIKDGVNILSASLGSFEPTFASPLGIAFMNAAAANIFVSAAAGNSGPDSGTVENLWPWITTVAASTIPRWVVREAAGLGSCSHIQPVDSFGSQPGPGSCHHNNPDEQRNSGACKISL